MQIALAFFHDFLVQIAYSFSVLSTNNIFFSWCLTSDSQTTQSHQTFLLDSSSQWWHLLSYNITLFLGFNIIVCVIGKLGINSKYHFFFFFFFLRLLVRLLRDTEIIRLILWNSMLYSSLFNTSCLSFEAPYPSKKFCASFHLFQLNNCLYRDVCFGTSSIKL